MLGHDGPYSTLPLLRCYSVPSADCCPETLFCWAESALSWQATQACVLHDAESRVAAQVRATLQELLRIFAALERFSADNTVWIKVLQRRPTLLSCTADQSRNTVSFLDMLDMSPGQVNA